METKTKACYEFNRGLTRWYPQSFGYAPERGGAYGTFDDHPDSEAPRPWNRASQTLTGPALTATHPYFDRPAS